MLIGSLPTPFCLPLELRLHQGFEPLSQRASAERALTLAERPVAMALALARQYARPALLILDAYLAVAPVFQLAASLWSSRDQAPSLCVPKRTM